MDKAIFMNDITPEELIERQTKGESLNILDVREPYEYEEFNLGAKLIPLGDLKEKLEEIRNWCNSEIVVHCRSGNRSAAAKAFLIQNGFTNVRSLLGGIVAYQFMESKE